jgi:3-hydroxymyristoyl/3-hydroxydecanoyl-(acyl carrier protein) dehydratase
MPGVMILEALAQTAESDYATLRKVPNAGTRFYFAGIDNCRFRRPVEPGDQLILTSRVERNMKASEIVHGGAGREAEAPPMLFPDADNATPLGTA